jgi:hypothetical protein
VYLAATLQTRYERFVMNITILRMRAAAVLVFGGLGAWVPYGALADTMEMEPEKYSALKAFADRRLITK